jgi:hypothetical protein
MTIDYRADKSLFLNNIIILINYIQKYNVKLFEKFNIRLDFLVLQTFLRSNYQQEITILENKDH